MEEKAPAEQTRKHMAPYSMSTLVSIIIRTPFLLCD